MRIFTGQYDRTIDPKNRIQLPSQLRAAIDEGENGKGLYITFGEHPGTLSIIPQKTFEDLAARIETEFIPGPESMQFELQYYGLASYVEIDKQGRILIPEKLRQKARLSEEVCLVGQKYRIDLWNRNDLARSLGIDWDGDEWVKWQGFLRMRPGRTGETRQN